MARISGGALTRSATGTTTRRSTWRSPGAEGKDISPQLEWSGAPAGTKGYAVTVYDADAPTPRGFWHWAVFYIPASVTSLPRGAGTVDGALLPKDAVQLPNDARVAGYVRATPPKGDGPHRYFIVVRALDVDTLAVPKDGTSAHISFVMLGHTLARATLVATSETS
ncbi:YbhB/YbcL family Raf kinase inhibitor-like protein [Stigmatella sp. ncwal1]|uniref:YbhB/YbcL family Raf kinase inhibitor-like protein n=1 Tax=Stigmatella ashevillensis TaxID=2995309 RepID=A0ABT5D9E4_9BACT|nr:YbhB/YbcL family Raf kinase inhibitor-like protein [Stigmatella ashevillena]MDC0710302.1 YbhB/YbcL family Raf kinase inhibitor-like protein [Stigmatella ashevillena]